MQICVFVSRVPPVFCTLCSLLALVSDIIGDQIVLPYSSFILVMAVYVCSSVSLGLLQCELVRAFIIF